MSISHRQRSPRRHARVVTAVLALTALAVTGCEWQNMRPPGDGLLRYRDEVFTSTVVTKDLVYGSATNQSGQVQALTLDLYRPPATDTVTERPAIVWIHGGAFQAGDKSSAELVDQATVFAKKGFVSISINYRLVTTGCLGTISSACLQGIVDARHDAQAAVRWLRANAATYGIDPTRIAAGGSSAGAITALNVAYGPEDVGASGNPGYDSTIRAAVSLSGAKILTTPNAGEAAVLLLHSTGDPVVPYQWATNTVTAAETAGTYLEITSWEETSHVPYTAHRAEVLSQTSNFLYWNLDLAHAAQ